MANYTPRVLKSGHINVAIQIYVKDATGKPVCKCTTFTNPDNLTGKRLEKAAYAFGQDWERKIRNGNDKDLNEATFCEIADIWLKSKEAKMSTSYKVRAIEGVERLKKYFGNSKFVDIRAYDVNQFFVYLNNFEFVQNKARVKEDKQEELNSIILSYGVRKAEKDGEISRPTLYYARKGENISLDSAYTICHKYNLKFNEYFDKIETRTKYKYETIMHYKRILSSIYTYAIKMELVSKNYASSSYVKDIIGGAEPQDIPVLTEAEYTRFLECLNNVDLFKSIPLYLLATLGLRSCEVCGLKWEDIDFNYKIISIRRDRLYVGKEYGVVENKTKTNGSTRDLYMCSLLEEKLKLFKNLYDELKLNDKEFCDEGYIFCNINGKPVFPHTLNSILKKYLLEANCNPISCHKVRHSWITRLISHSTPVNVVSKMAGHADSDITLKIYTHYCKDIDNSKQTLEKIFGNKLA